MKYFIDMLESCRTGAFIQFLLLGQAWRKEEALSMLVLKFWSNGGQTCLGEDRKRKSRASLTGKCKLSHLPGTSGRMILSNSWKQSLVARDTLCEYCLERQNSKTPLMHHCGGIYPGNSVSQGSSY